jgi:hypothetical protein
MTRYASGRYHLASGTRKAFAAWGADLVAAGYAEPVVNSGDREEALQEQIFRDAYVPSSGPRDVGPFNDRRYWTGHGYWKRVKGNATIAAPGASNHEKRRASDLAYPYDRDTPAHRAGQALAKRHNITCEGMGFREWWHWTFWGPLGTIDTPGGGSASGGATDAVTPTPDTALLRRRKENAMYISGTSFPDVYAVEGITNDVYPKGQALMRVCTAPEANYAITGGLVIKGLDTSLQAIATVCGYGLPMPTKQRDDAEVIMIQDGDALTYALWARGFWDTTEGMKREDAIAVANGWARLYGNAKNLTYAEWEDRKRVGTAGRD